MRENCEAMKGIGRNKRPYNRAISTLTHSRKPIGFFFSLTVAQQCDTTRHERRMMGEMDRDKEGGIIEYQSWMALKRLCLTDIYCIYWSVVFCFVFCFILFPFYSSSNSLRVCVRVYVVLETQYVLVVHPSFDLL